MHLDDVPDTSRLNVFVVVSEDITYAPDLLPGDVLSSRCEGGREVFRGLCDYEEAPFRGVLGDFIPGVGRKSMLARHLLDVGNSLENVFECLDGRTLAHVRRLSRHPC